MITKRIHKVFRSRYFWGVLGIALELAQLLAVFTLLFEYFLPITILGILFHIGILLYVINRDEIPEFKIPWLIILFLRHPMGENGVTEKFKTYQGHALAVVRAQDPGIIEVTIKGANLSSVTVEITAGTC